MKQTVFTFVVAVCLLQFEPGGNSNRWVSEANVGLASGYGNGRFAELNNANWVAAFDSGRFRSYWL